MNFYSYRYMLWHGGRQSATADAAINYTEHDKRYHHGNFDPKTMTCEMREAEAKGDLVDVLNAEQTEADYAKRKAKALKKANKEEAKAARSAEIEHKTIAELSSREYSDEDRRMVNEAVRHVRSSQPIEVKIDEALNVAKKIRSNKSGMTKHNLTKFFEEQFPQGIEVNGVGKCELNRESAASIIAHGRAGLKLPKLAAISALRSLINGGKVFCVNPHWKGRSTDSIGIVAPMRLGDKEKVVEIIISRNTQGRCELYNIRVFDKEEVEAGTRLDTLPFGKIGEKSLTSTTAHSIPNSPAEVNRDITEKSHAAEKPILPTSNLMRQYLAAHGLLGQFLQK